MSVLESIKPQTKERVIDLVEKAKFDVTDWASYDGHPSQNPKFCYEWAYTDPDRGIILNLWHPQFEEKDGAVFRVGSFRDDERHLGKPQWKARARKMDLALKLAWEKDLPVQVIMLDGLIRKIDGDKPSKVEVRGLDSEFWHVGFYDAETGDHRIVRGARLEGAYVDQFSHPEFGTETPQRRETSSKKFFRDPKVRRWVLGRAKGSCEFCGEQGFKTLSGMLYLETHHIIPLSEGGSDLITNVIALCPNHHREAHYGENWKDLRVQLFEVLSA